MIIWIMGILLIASFACFVFYAMRGGNLTVGFFILTIVWLAIYFLGVAFGVGQPFDIINDVFAQPALTYDHHPDRLRRMVRPCAGRYRHRRLDLLPHRQGR